MSTICNNKPQKKPKTKKTKKTKKQKTKNKKPKTKTENYDVAISSILTVYIRIYAIKMLEISTS